MKRFISGLIGCAALCGLALGDEPVLTDVFADNFNDNARNLSAWKQTFSKPTTRLIESAGRLRYTTGDVNPLDSTFALWQLKKSRVMISKDRLESSVLVKLPHVSEYNTASVVRMGIRLSDPNEVRNSIVLSVQRKKSGLSFRVSYGGALNPVGMQAQKFAILPVVDKLYLLIIYSCQSGKATFWWRRPNETHWAMIPLEVNVATLWGTSYPTVNVSLVGESSKYWISIADGLYFDNFKVIQEMPL
jgi:hypothetical protein